MIRRMLLSLVATASLLLLGPLAAPAAADDCGLGGTGSGCATKETVSTGTGYYTIPGTSCGAWVSTGGWGGACAAPGSYTGGGGEIPTWREIIRASGDRFDPCRLDRLAPGFNQPPPPVDEEERAEGDEWLIRICMDNFDLDSTYGGPDIELQMERVWDRYEPEPPWMDYIWGDVAANQSSFPYAMVDYGPNPYPVVNSPIFFYIDFQRFTTDGPVSMGSRGRIEVPIGIDAGSGQTIYLVAVARGVTIDTGDGGVARCNDREDRSNRFEVGEDEIKTFARTTGCKWTYEHSSAAQDDDAYDVTARSRWEVRYRVGDSGPLTLLDNNERTVVQTKMSYQIPVQEVQVRDCVVAQLCGRS